MTYPKIENLYASNEVNGKERRRGPEFGVRAPGAEQVNRWLVTEKVDGMNVRVVLREGFQWDDEEYRHRRRVFYHGRTDKAVLPADLLAHLESVFTLDKLVSVFADENDQLPECVTLYGEGFGAGIQKAGSAYGGEKRFILFDVKVGNWWLDWDDVVDVATKLGVPTVPVLGRDVTTEEAKGCVDKSLLLPAGSEHIEGIVARTDPYLFDRQGHRVMFKYKVRDLC